MVSLIQHFEADFLWKVSLKILNSGIILKTFTHASFSLDKSGLPVYGIRLRSLSNSADCFGNPIFRTNALQT